MRLSDKKTREVENAVNKALRDPKNARKPDKILYQELFPDQVEFKTFRQFCLKFRQEQEAEKNPVHTEPLEVEELRRQLEEANAEKQRLAEQLDELNADGD